jgi:hypothetical protein
MCSSHLVAVVGATNCVALKLVRQGAQRKTQARRRFGFVFACLGETKPRSL